MASMSPRGCRALVEPGGICISGKVRDEVDRKISVVFDDMGEQALKNSARRCAFIVCGVGHLASSA